MKIENLKKKVKILIEYPKGFNSTSYAIIHKKDLDKLHLRVFLNNGKNIFEDDIKQITLKVKNE